MDSAATVVGDGLVIDSVGFGNTVVLRSGSAALLINAVAPGLAARLRAAGVERVERVLFTSHRRDLADGLAEVLSEWSPGLVVPASERDLFEDPGAYWSAASSRWRLLCGHVPSHITHVRPLAVAQGVAEGDVITWHDWRIRVLATPGHTDGAVSYLVHRGEAPPVAVTGDLIWGPGQVRDLHSLQRSVTRNGHRLGDYHGFMGAMDAVLASLERVLAEGPSRLLPAHGLPIDRPVEAVALLRGRFLAAYHNYVSISALRWYFPKHFAEEPVDRRTLPQQETHPLPGNVLRLHGTTWALRADDGHALLIDPYCDEALAKAAGALADGRVAAYDAIWITHYHYDHLDRAAAARERFGIPILVDEGMAEVVSHPERFFLTCLSPLAATVDGPTRDGQTWRWRNYRLTAYHFPGQSLYHGGLLAVPDRGPRLFFAGDAVTPCGIDDYCAWNRNWLGRGVGYDHCLHLLRDLAPDLIFNQHVEFGFRFSEDAYELMLDVLREREPLLRALVPWPHADFGTDIAWAHAYPYEQPCRPGDAVEVALRVRNHAGHPAEAHAEVVLSDGWSAPVTALSAPCAPGRESSLVFVLAVPPTAEGRVVVPIRVTFGEHALGACCEAILRVEATAPAADGNP